MFFLIIWNHVSESCSKFLVYCFTGRQNQRYPCSGCNGSLLVYFNYLWNHFLILSALLTLISLLPSLTILFFSCTKKNFIVCLVISSLSFYLFSFQVHEKSILLAAMYDIKLIGRYLFMFRPALFLLYDENMCYFTSLFLFISQIRF